MEKIQKPYFIKDTFLRTGDGNPTKKAYLLLFAAAGVSSALLYNAMTDRKENMLCDPEFSYNGQFGNRRFEIYGVCPDKVTLSVDDKKTVVLPWREILNSDYTIYEKGLERNLE